MPEWLIIAAFATVALYVLFVAILLALGRRSEARALAGFVPDCLVLFKRLLGDDRVSRQASCCSRLWSPTWQCLSISCPTSSPSPASSTTPFSYSSCCAPSFEGHGPPCPRTLAGPTSSLALMLGLAGSHTAPPDA
jgi:hypothetical protein